MAMMAFLAVVVVAGFAQLWSSQRDGPVVGSMRELAVLYPEIPAQTSDRAEVSARLYQMLTSTLAPVSGLRLVGRVSVPRLAAQGLRSAQIDDSLRAEGVDSALALSATVSTSGALMLALELRSLADRGVETVGGPITVMSIERVAPDSLLVIVRQLAAQGVAKMHLGSSNRAVSETQRIDAYMTWLSGRDGMARRSPEGINAAVALFERAIALDSAYAQAHADLSQTLSLALFYHYRLAASPYEMAARAMSHADRAVKLNPELADGYLARALLGTVAGAPTTFVQANFDSVARYPGANPYSQTFYLGLLAKLGNFDEAVQRAEEEVRLDGRSAGQRIASAVYSLPAGQYLTALRNATAARDLLRDVPMVSQLELISRLRLDGKALADCVNVAAGPYIGARALCLERVGRENDGRALSDSLFAMLTGKAAMDSTFDLALYLGEMAMYGAQHLEREAMRQWLSQAFKESPAGVDFRIMRSGIFDKSAIQFADSVQLLGWSRVLRTPATRAPAVSP
jgi:tetratricopeptide (TPR) repeat protein